VGGVIKAAVGLPAIFSAPLMRERAFLFLLMTIELTKEEAEEAVAIWLHAKLGGNFIAHIECNPKEDQELEIWAEQVEGPEL